MSRLSKIVDEIQFRFSGGYQAVYDPSYVYSPWRKWAVLAVIVAILGLIYFVIYQRAQQDSTVRNQDATSAAIEEAGSRHKADAKSANPESQTQSSNQSSQGSYQVVNVVDGDTVDVIIDGRTERIRLIGVDTPETVDPRRTVECFGVEASQKAKSMLSGVRVNLESDPTQDNRDRYSRLLRYVYLQDGTSFNKYMITEGYAHEYTYNTPYKYQAEFIAAEQSAKDNGRGLWSPSSCGV